MIAHAAAGQLRPRTRLVERQKLRRPSWLPTPQPNKDAREPVWLFLQIGFPSAGVLIRVLIFVTPDFWKLPCVSGGLLSMRQWIFQLVPEDKIRQFRNLFCCLCWAADHFSSLHPRNRGCLESPSVGRQEVVRWHSVGRDRNFTAAGRALRESYLCLSSYGQLASGFSSTRIRQPFQTPQPTKDAPEPVWLFLQIGFPSAGVLIRALIFVAPDFWKLPCVSGGLLSMRQWIFQLVPEDKIRQFRNLFCCLCWAADHFSSLPPRNRGCLESPSVGRQEVVRWHSVGRDRNFIAAGTARILLMPV